MTEEEISQLQTEKEALQNELATTARALRDTQEQLKQRDAAFAPLEQELAETKAQFTERDEAAASWQTHAAEKEAELTAANEAIASAIAGYRTLAVSANPAIPQEMITGDSIEEINTSLESARTIVGKVTANVQASLAQGNVPPGAPSRGELDLSGLSPREKIRHGLVTDQK